jgi:hypothetical protein
MLQRRLGRAQRHIGLQRHGQVAYAIGECRTAPGAARAQRHIRIRARPAADGLEGQGQVLIQIETLPSGQTDRQSGGRGSVDGGEADRNDA